MITHASGRIKYIDKTKCGLWKWNIFTMNGFGCCKNQVIEVFSWRFVPFQLQYVYFMGQTSYKISGFSEHPSAVCDGSVRVCVVCHWSDSWQKLFMQQSSDVFYCFCQQSTRIHFCRIKLWIKKCLWWFLFAGNTFCRDWGKNDCSIGKFCDTPSRSSQQKTSSEFDTQNL